MVSCAPTQRRQPRRPSSDLSWMPYTPLRSPSRVAAPSAAAPLPPPATTPMKANCEPPVNISRLSAMACPTVRPAATASAPKDTPYSPVAAAIDRPMRVAGLRRPVRAGGSVMAGRHCATAVARVGSACVGAVAAARPSYNRRP